MSIQALPQELLPLIFRHLPEKEIPGMGNVCKRWNAAMVKTLADKLPRLQQNKCCLSQSLLLKVVAKIKEEEQEYATVYTIFRRLGVKPERASLFKTLPNQGQRLKMIRNCVLSKLKTVCATSYLSPSLDLLSRISLEDRRVVVPEIVDGLREIQPALALNILANVSY